MAFLDPSPPCIQAPFMEQAISNTRRVGAM